MDYPVVVEAEGIKIRSEKMQVDKLYYCIYQEKILLFYKEQNEMLNCYEIAEKDIVEEVKKSQSEDIEKIFQQYLEKKNLV
jgi:RecA-family ATPase